MNVAPSPDHLTQAVKLTAVCEARQSCYVLQLCLARSMPSHAIDAIVKLYKNDVLT